MKKVLCLVVVITIAVLIVGCGNTISKNFGGTVVINLEPNTKLEVITWKDDSLWTLTRPMKDDEEAETYNYKQHSNFGVIEGEVIVKEKKVEK